MLTYEYPPIGGGAGIVFSHLAKWFAEHGQTVIVVTVWMDGLPYFEAYNNIEIYRVPSRRAVSHRSNPLEMISWIVEASKVTKEHIHTWNPNFALCNFTIPGGLLGWFFKNKYKLPFIVVSHAHDIPWLYPKQMFLWHLICYFPIVLILNNSKNNVLLTQSVKDAADQLLSKKNRFKNVVISNGVEVGDMKTFEQSDILKIAFVGRMVEQKNPFLFLEVLHFLSKHEISFQAEMCGDGPMKNRILNKILECNLQNVSYLGKVSHAQSLNKIYNANLLLVTSKFEGMSLVILEAVQAGTWVITTKVDGIENIVKEGVNGNILDSQNPLLIAQTVERYYNTMLKTGHSINKEHLDDVMQSNNWKTIASKYLELISQ